MSCVSPAADRDDPVDPELEARTLTFINELTNRRRVSMLFANPQPRGEGVAVNFVNSASGSVTFVQRDLVIPGRMPLVLGRVYDSKLARGDFGPGWKLLPVESVRRQRGGLVYTDANNGVHRLRVDGAEVSGDDPLVAISGRIDGRGISLQAGGLTRHFERNGAAFVLTRVEDRYGNWISLDYDRGRLIALGNSSGETVALTRHPDGRIAGLRAGTGGSVGYDYDARGRLVGVAVGKRGGEAAAPRWRFDYEGARLASAVDGDGRDIVRFEYDERGRATLASQHGRTAGFAYDGRLTTVFSPEGLAATIEHAADGTPTRLTDFGGHTMTREVLSSGAGREEVLRFDGSPVARAVVGGGRLQALSLLAGDAPVHYDFRYGAAAALERVDIDGRAWATIAGDDNGARVAIRRGERETVIDRDAAGDVVSVSTDGGTVSLVSDERGLVREASWPGLGYLGLSYSPDGSVAALDFNGRYRARFAYDTRALRTRADYADDLAIDFDYDQAGNMRAMAFVVDGAEIRRDDYEVGPHNELLSISSDVASGLAFAHDVAGRVTRAYGNGRVLEVAYDPAGRVVEATVDGSRVLADDYDHYGQGRVLEADEKTPRVLLRYAPGSGAFGGIDELIYNRPVYHRHPAWVFDAEAMRFRVVPVAAMLPHTTVMTSLFRRGLSPDVVDGAALSPWRFDSPANSLFIPPEYASINCRVCVAAVIGHTLTIDVPDEVSVVSTETDVTVTSRGFVEACYEPTPNDPLFSQPISGDVQFLPGPLPAIVEHRLDFDDGTSSVRTATGSPYGIIADISTNKRFASAGTRRVDARLACSCGLFGVSTRSQSIGVQCQSGAGHRIDGCSIPEQVTALIFGPLGGTRNDPVGGDAGLYTTEFGSDQGTIAATARHLVANLPCNQHDVCYQTCGASRASCDARFRDDMHAVCDAAYVAVALPGIPFPSCPWLLTNPTLCVQWSAERVQCPATADAMYVAVRAGGAIPFSNNQDKHCSSNPNQCVSLPTASSYGGIQ